ncbi:hypothetical protein HDU79_003559 [Rhizoclosmatium sp. JEL0117]|nr:hypothetical protein HDU79_003559 [Rhizoclosmatium sp. JEL0117]
MKGFPSSFVSVSVLALWTFIELFLFTPGVMVQQSQGLDDNQINQTLVLKDPNHVGLTESECLSHFPRLYEELENTTAFYASKEGVFLSDLDSIEDYHIRIVIQNNTLYVKEFIHDFGTRGMSVLYHLHQILSFSSEALPDVEMVINLRDKGSPRTRAVFSFAKQEVDAWTWLIPDFRFHSWPEGGIITYQRLREQIGLVSDGTVGNEAVYHSQTTKSRFSPDICRNKFISYDTNNGSPSSLLYALNCKSVVFGGKLEWKQHFHHILDSDNDSPHQNIVFVPSIKNGLKEAIASLKTSKERADKIAENLWNNLRNRYLTPAATSCYWRKLIHQYASVLKFKPSLQLKKWSDGRQRTGAAGTGKAVPYESFVLLQKVEWKMY